MSASTTVKIPSRLTLATIRSPIRRLPTPTPHILSQTTTLLTRYAEMEKSEKNKISHRFRALEKLLAWLKTEEGQTS